MIVGERIVQDDGYTPIGAPPFQIDILEGRVNKTVVFARHFEALFRAVEWSDESKEIIKNIVNKSSDRLGFILVKNKVWETFPAGHPGYDRKFVVEVAEVLGEKSKEEFLSALRLYKEGKGSLAVGKTRRALEELLRELLHNKKGLNSNLAELKKWLDEKGTDEAIIKYFTSLIGFIDQKYNDLEKHNSVNHDSKSAEYFIYQAGLISRYLLRIRDEA
jgi:hypothetical protein